MSEMADVLVTGFEPWGKHKTNPSGELAKALGGIVLPTEYRASEKALLDAVATRRPRAVVLLGLADTRKRLSIEMIAVNVDHADIADNARERRQSRTIERAGELALPTRLPARQMLNAVKAARVPVALSYHAGTFCCNHIFYIALRRLNVPCGFVHVPPFRAVPFVRLRRAVEAILRCL
jgi:pyroglutamyl-peptidase